MEEQKLSAQHFEPDSSDPADKQLQPLSQSSLSSSELTLRFPRPQGNRQLASWIASSHSDIMTPSADPYGDATASLSESTFEFIHTDDESQDGPASESLDSFDDSRADDVHSLAGTEQSADDLETDSEIEFNNQETREEEEDEVAEEEQEARNNSQVYAEESLSSPSTPASASIIDPTTNTPSFLDPTLAPSRGASASQDPKHVSDEEDLARQNDTPNISWPPFATVHQRMDEEYLLIKKPLRIMYVGSPTAQEDIVKKMASALTAPSGPGSSQLDEAEFRRTHIKVERCTLAQETAYMSTHGVIETMIFITVDGERTYSTLAHRRNFHVTSHWTVPDFAVFYASQEDDAIAGETRDAAWLFMKQHCVPCILISDPQLCLLPVNVWSKYIDGRAIHRRLFSSHNRQTGRLPVDLTSFLNVDSGKLNRNLAYLARRYSRKREEKPGESEIEGLCAHASKAAREIWRYMLDRCPVVSTYVLIHLLLFGLTAVVCYGVSRVSLVAPPIPAPGAVHQPLTSPPPVASTAIYPDSTMTSNLTSTTMVDIPRANASPTNLALAPFPSFFSESVTGSQESTVCSAEVHGRNEILVKIPLSTKTTWLAKDSISIDVLRGGRLVKTKFSSIDEGLLIEIPMSEAYGPISVTVVTTRKPKVNETFEVDFGKSIIEEVVDFGRFLVDRVSDVAGGVAKAADRVRDKARDTASETPELVLSLRHSLLKKLTDLPERVRAETSVTVDYLKNAWSNSNLMPKQWRRIQDETSRHMEDYSDQVRLSVLKAQIASHLGWLRLQGKHEEYNLYREKAKAYLADKYSEAVKARQVRHRTDAKTSSESGCRSWRWSRKCWLGDK
ncbi:hypothetical protein SODALDRAFT_7627 [Sodiomyces alkalinus F11]|uniref:Uncharacterized protein n=1 Tax=Sodiomyces alkalinus (strain CBS 110278 / VKM F-3762 / F11) TaxID=1314773 RepID=A0A3N2Q5T4_SODAK|nr:hypothetical protein SODALDRAFT_7627 [Sodiomyces alkalinus F11]ROT42112.1 hypothetical protein SODALDRAFT_7627 [Sodiomyces alkalinus F11]